MRGETRHKHEGKDDDAHSRHGTSGRINAIDPLNRARGPGLGFHAVHPWIRPGQSEIMGRIPLRLDGDQVMLARVRAIPDRAV
jgi:hypothetical protein